MQISEARLTKKDQLPPHVLEMGQTADQVDPGQMPNRAMRRAYGKLKGKRHFLETLADTMKSHTTTLTPSQQTQSQPPNDQTTTSEEDETMQLSDEEKQSILEHEDVKKVMWILSDLLTGKKRLVIQSRPAGNGIAGQNHTFSLEETDNAA
jgi:hypothetical protein